MECGEVAPCRFPDPERAGQGNGRADCAGLLGLLVAKGWTAFLRKTVLGVVCVLAFLAVRPPLDWFPLYEAINGMGRLMISDNLGIGPPCYHSLASVWENHLHLALVAGTFLFSIVFG